MSSKALVNGKTYYVRVQGNYLDAAGKSTKTDYSEIRSFVFNSEDGVDAVTTSRDEVGHVFYTLSGVKIEHPQSGQVVVKVSTFSDGSVKAAKILTK